MRYFISIEKICAESNIHYYTVFKEEDCQKVDYYIGLDSVRKKIYFFKDSQFKNSPNCIYDLQTDKMEKYDPSMLSSINPRVIMKAIRTLKDNNFPSDISWAG
jgi:hypothetical protein